MLRTSFILTTYLIKILLFLITFTKFCKMNMFEDSCVKEKQTLHTSETLNRKAICILLLHNTFIVVLMLFMWFLT